MLEAVRNRHVLSIMPTYQCTAACRDCGTFSTPRSGQPWLDPTYIFRAIEQAAAANYLGIVFTGGEPTLAIDTVLTGLALAKQLGLATRIVTNASWATDEAAADAMIGRLAGAGLDELNISTGDEHIRFVPLDNVCRAVAAALAHRLRGICVMVEVTSDATHTQADLVGHPRFVAATRDQPAGRVRVLPSPWMPMSSKRTHNYPDEMLIARRNLGRRTGCTSCLSTTTLQADGRIAACCGLGMRAIPELQLGHIASTTIAEADDRGANDVLKRWIRLEGPERILAWAAEKDDSIAWEDAYAHQCQACMRLYRDPKIREIIRTRYHEKIADIAFGEFLLSHFEPSRDVLLPPEIA